MLNFSNSLEKERIANQENLFNSNDELSINIPEILDWSLLEKLNNEFSSLGMYLSNHPLDNFSMVLKNLKITKSSDLNNKSNVNISKNIQLCGLIFKVQKRQSLRGKWAVIFLNDLGGDFEITLYSDILIKYENLLDEKRPILIDAEIKYDINQGHRIIGKRLRIFDEYISNAKLNLTIAIKNITSIQSISKAAKNLVNGPSTVYFEFDIEENNIQIKVKENIKFTQLFLDQVSKVKGIKSITYSQ
jgi:DNA polymerase-3 subunit alpha